MRTRQGGALQLTGRCGGRDACGRASGSENLTKTTGLPYFGGAVKSEATTLIWGETREIGEAKKFREMGVSPVQNETKMRQQTDRQIDSYTRSFLPREN